MAAGHVYHWKHGWIPLTYFAALQKAHGSRSGAINVLHASSAVHGSESPGRYYGGIHSSMAAQRTAGELIRKGVSMKIGATTGTPIYWRHPGTGRQVEARVVGIEHTGHIIIEHSGNRNALIGHSTYSLTPHADTPLHPKTAGSFANPHIHTRVIEQDANGNPVYPKGYKPRAPRPASKRGTTVFEKSYPTPTHETAPRVDAKPDLTPTAPKFAPLPDHFSPLDPSSITAYHTISAMARVNERSKIRQAFQLGPHKVLIQSALTKDQTQGLLHDIKETLHQAHPTIGEHGVTFLVPTGDGYFRSRKNGGDVLGYVVRGGSTVHINPKVATGVYQATEAANNGHFMPAAKGASTRRYVITHELGHVVDNMNMTTRSDRAGHAHPGVQHFVSNRSKLSKYGSSSVSEGFAEAFAQHQLGGVHHGTQHTIAEKYAQIYGWQKAK